MGRPWQDENTLHELYVEEGLTTTEIGERLDCGEGTVWRWLDKHDIDRRNRGPQREHTKLQDESWLSEQYHDKGKTAYEIADDIGCTSGNVYYWMRKHSINTRDTRIPQVECLADPEWVETEWVEKDRSAREIGDELGVYGATVLYWAYKHGIEKPTKDRLYYGQHWDKQREKRLEKDDYECVVCSMSEAEHADKFGKSLEVHHIQPLREFVDESGSVNHEEANKIENLITMCINCHSKWEGVPLRPDVAQK